VHSTQTFTHEHCILFFCCIINTLQAQTNIQAFHRCGQTFVTWMESPMAQTYRIYRHAQPISLSNLAQAQYIVTLGQGSGRHITEEWRNNGFYTVVQTRFIIQDMGAELADGTGLMPYTTQVGETGYAYYAVTRVQDGQEILDIQSGINSTQSAVNEIVAEPCAVKVWQSQDGLSAVYTQFVDIKNWNITYDGFAYNYAVMKPQGYNPTQQYPMVIDLHCWGCRYNVTTENGSLFGIPVIYVYPDDAGRTWWFGFSKTHQYRPQWPDSNYGIPSEPATSGPIVNYTEQRVLRILDDIDKMGGYNYDPNRIYMWGNSMGGSGVISMASRYPDIIAAGYSSIGVTNYQVSHWNDVCSYLWGPTSLDLPVEIKGKHAQKIAQYSGQSVWDWQNAQLQMTQRMGDEMAYLATAHGDADIYVEWWNQGEPWYHIMQNTARRGGSGWTQNNGGHDWMNFKGTNLNWGWLTNQGEQWNFKKNYSFPAFTHLSSNTWTHHNLNVQYACPWNYAFQGEIIDTPTDWSVLLKMADNPSFASNFNPLQVDSATVDVTPRRLQQFHTAAGKAFSWNYKDDASGAILASGNLVADAFGLVTIPNLKLKKTARRLSIHAEDNVVLPTCNAPQNLTAISTQAHDVSLLWSVSMDAFHQNLRYRKVGTSNWQSLTLGTEITTILHNLDSCTMYECQIQSQCAGGLLSDFTQILNFSTDCPPSPNCDAPHNLLLVEANENTASLHWSASSDALHQTFQYRKTGALTWISMTLGSENTTTLVHLDSCSTYECRVQSQCAGGLTSDFTPVFVFHTDCPPPPVDCIAPHNLSLVGATTTTASLHWVANLDAFHQNFQYRKLGETIWQNITLGIENSLTLFHLDSCAHYEVQVQSICEAGLTSDFTPILTITTDCVPHEPLVCEHPFGLSLMDSAATQIGLAWAINNAATSYKIRYRPHNTTNWQMATSLNNSLTINDLLSCTYYETNIKAVCDTTESVWSATYIFKTLGCIIATENINGAEKVYIFPNPANDFLNVQNIGFLPINYELVNILGEKVQSERIFKGKSEFQINLKTLVAGSYFLILKNEKGEAVVKRFLRS
jgi:predicted peptidase